MRAFIVVILALGAVAAPKEEQKTFPAVETSVDEPKLVVKIEKDISAYVDIHLKEDDKKKEITDRNFVDILFRKENQLRNSFNTFQVEQRQSIPAGILVLLAIAKIVLFIVSMGSTTDGPSNTIQTSSALQTAQDFMENNPNFLRSLIAILPGLLPVVFPSDSSAIDPDIILNGTTSTAISRLEKLSGELYFAQLKPKSGETEAMTVISGAIQGLKPGLHTIRIHRSGDVSENCTRVGDEFLSLGGRTFVTDAEGRTVLFLQELGVPLVGDGNIMGRSVVITSKDNAMSYCGVVMQT